LLKQVGGFRPREATFWNTASAKSVRMTFLPPIAPPDGIGMHKKKAAVPATRVAEDPSLKGTAPQDRCGAQQCCYQIGLTCDMKFRHTSHAGNT
jgi:hypothetical protein